MALELLLRNTDFYVYRGCAGNYDGFYSPVGGGGMCGTSSKVYFETISMLDSFVYDAAIDKYRFITWNTIANWPTWEISASIINPETGVEESRTKLIGYAVAHAWTGPAFNGGLNKIYAGYIVPNYRIVEVLLPDGIPTTAMIDNPLVTATQIPSLAATNYGFGICPERKLVTIMSGMEGIVVYDYSPYPNPATLLHRWPFPETFGWSMGYEDDERVWMLFAGAIFGSSNDYRQTLLKYNFASNKMELCTELQLCSSPDRLALVAWDTKRKKLGAVRIKDDSANGKHNNAFEIYSPHIAIAHVTVPVNIRAMSKANDVPLISHAVGTKGEAGGMKEVSISCTPTASLIKIPKQITEANGRVEFEINPPTTGANESISVSYDETKVII